MAGAGKFHQKQYMRDTLHHIVQAVPFNSVLGATNGLEAHRGPKDALYPTE